MKYLLSLSYDGTDYCGWVIQPKQPTIQGELEKALKRITKTSNFKVLGASKTDAGVHALDQKVLLTIEFVPNLAQFKSALNKSLPSDIRVIDIISVSESFDVRRVAQKTYHYLINDQIDDIFSQRFELRWNKQAIDIVKLQQIFNAFIGTHDFKLFSGLNELEKKTIKTVRQIDTINIFRNSNNRIVVEFKAKGFIRYQIRMIVGVALYAYQNKQLSIEIINQKLQGIGEKSPIVAIAKGLCLQKIKYS
ncbi:tRNA pseudouridine(38-40) synthase TruA [Mesoplasma syrphidae]|uniref:tRNA pseudouridine synthase A n=1 Tax=Mesoplasma syrphidae TaxID=225999 RepID=A0A2K9C8J6_9MOLU|nr:tRNA pseudouridine(38-40) synthase TruA [Mesoplasma syrphidae]AUF83335.1 tRNA pseudouridine(38-40) synthase TruA [Mesoplasma syrphidae]